MTFARLAGAACCLIAISLWLQSGGMAVLIIWARRVLSRDIQKLGLLHSMVLVVRVTVAIIVLNLL